MRLVGEGGARLCAGKRAGLETLNVVYVVDERGKLIDDIRMREFLLKPLTHKVSAEIWDQTFVESNVADPDAQEAVNVFRKYDRTALPVIDSSGVLVGIVTIDDMLDVAEEEATEEIQKFGGMEAWMSRTCASRSCRWSGNGRAG